MDDDGLPNARPIALSDSPRCQRPQSSVFSAAVKPRKYPRPIAVHSFPFQDRVLRRPVETTVKKRHCSVIDTYALPPKSDITDFMSTRSSTTLADLLTLPLVANPFSTVRATLRRRSSEEFEDGVAYGWQSWLRRGPLDSFFPALLL